MGFIAFVVDLLQLIFVAVLYSKIGTQSIKLLVFSAIILVVAIFYIICSIHLYRLHKRLDNNIKKQQKMHGLN